MQLTCTFEKYDNNANTVILFVLLSQGMTAFDQGMTAFDQGMIKESAMESQIEGKLLKMLLERKLLYSHNHHYLDLTQKPICF